MSFPILRAVPRTSPSLLTRALQQRTQALPCVLTRTYASNASPGQSSNVSNPQANSAEGQEVNQSRATDRRAQQDTGSVQTPVSNPSASGVGQQEEQTESQAQMKRDPREPNSKKREEVLKHGQSKKLDPADD